MNKKETILIVDDERFNINVLSDLLNNDYEIMVAKSGKQTLKLLQNEYLPDLILLDIMMPDMDGFETCKMIKQDKRTEDIPIIFITALDRDHDEQMGLELGAVDYISKPFTPMLVRLRVKNHLRLKRQNDMLKEMVNIDGLTGIYNRRHFNEELIKSWDLSLRFRTTITVVLMDIDFFKQFNDNYGHLSGDDCLQRVAQALSAVVGRQTDLVARYGGEEFVGLLTNTDPEGAIHVAASFNQAVAALQIPHEKSTVSDHVTISVGVATIVAKEDGSPDELIALADQCLYQAKERGRNQVVQA